MLRISLVNMPFSSVEIPSIALTQLAAVVARRFGSRVAVEIHYLCHDVCRELGRDDYRLICDEAAHSGLGDWLFRRIAFPEQADNTADYQRRYFPAHDSRRAAFERLCARRADLDRLLGRLIDRHGLDRADLVGFTSMFTQSVASFALARQLKSRRGDLVIAMGGANCESPMGEEIAKQVEAIDYVFSGPALLSFPALVAGYLESDPSRVLAENGVFTRASENRRGTIGDELDINEEVPLDYSSFLASFERAFAPAGSAERQMEPVLLFETSRGCWWGERAHCTFCGLNGSTMSYRAMEPDRAVALIRSLFAYHPRVRQLSCVDNILPKSYPREVFARLDLAPLDFYAKTYPFPSESLENLAYYFVDRNVTAPYFFDVALWIGRLRKAVEAWRAPWLAGTPPVLGFEPAGGTIIRDTRAGTPVYHEVGETGRRLLLALVEPLSLADLGRQLGLPEAELQAELAWLADRGLLFADRNRRISLVLPETTQGEKIASRYVTMEAVPA
jgi:hypothetical protein